MILRDLFKDKTLFDKAMRLAHKGRSAEYERLEFLGDRVIGMIVAELLYTTFPQEKEGDLAKRFVALTREETLADIAKTLGLPNLLKTNENELRYNSSILSDVCEAMIAALYLDSDLETVKTFITPFLIPLISTNQQAPQDAKSALQEWAQKIYKKLPTYTLVSQKGPDHNPVFTVSVTVETKSALGTGSSKKIAEQQAAQNLMEAMNNGH